MSLQPARLPHHPRVVIVGAGFGGLAAARGLNGAPVRVTLIDRTNHHLFQPLLYQVATAGLSPADIAEPVRAILRRQANVEVLMAAVRGVDTEGKTVLLDDRAVPYDILVLATGARHSYFGRPEWSRWAPGLKSISDATAIRRSVLTAFEHAEMEQDAQRRAADLTFVVVGAGPTGVEMAGAIAELARKVLAADFRQIDPASARVLLIEAGPRVLPTFPPSLSLAAQRALKRLGVEVRTGQPVENIAADGVTVAGERIPARTIVWAAGVQASPAGAWLGAATDPSGRVRVGPDLTPPGLPDVYVIGDTARFEQDGRPVPGVAQVALQQGRFVARAIRRRVAGDPSRPAFRYRDKGSMATIGRSAAVACRGRIRMAGFAAWIAWLGVHIYFLIGFQRRLMVLLQWAWAYLAFRRGARLIVPDHSPAPEDDEAAPPRAGLPDEPEPAGAPAASRVR